ncbi:MAG: RNA methyltransferase [Planctomycetota bacterium]|nr:MAG: RNA methyltransferase [Planctomycetota bacterium]
MEIQPIRSAANARLKAARAVRAGRDRSRLLLEGEHLLDEALAAGVVPEWVLHDDRAPAGALARAAAAGAEVVPCASNLLDGLSDLDSPRGLLALAPRPAATPPEVFAVAGGAPVLVSAGVQEPGNVGALVRVAAGLGAGGFVALKGGASPWSPRALRGAAGTTFRLPVAERAEPKGLVAAAASAGYALWGADAGGEPLAGPAPGPLALILGEEGRGLGPVWRSSCARLVAVPLARGVESLNVATAGAVLLAALTGLLGGGGGG